MSQAQETALVIFGPFSHVVISLDWYKKPIAQTEAGSQTPTPQESLEPCMGGFKHVLVYRRISGSQNVMNKTYADSFEAISASATMIQ